MLGLVLLVFSFVCAVISAFADPVTVGPLRINFLGAAVAFLVASMLFGGKMLGVH